MSKYHRRTKIEHGLVKFPLRDEKYKNTGEGGMAVYAVFFGESLGKVCIDGTGISILGDCPVSKWYRKLERENEARAIKRLREDVKWYAREGVQYAWLEKMGKEWKELTGRTSDYSIVRSPKKYKIPEKVILSILSLSQDWRKRAVYVSGIVYLGSTDVSLWDGKDYFQAKMEHLTPEGRNLIKTLERLYGTKARLLTTLDT